MIENEAEIIKNVPVNLIYNEEAYVVENVPETVDITITGRKSDIYLAKQLGEFAVELDLSKYNVTAGAYESFRDNGSENISIVSPFQNGSRAGQRW